MVSTKLSAHIKCCPMVYIIQEDGSTLIMQTTHHPWNQRSHDVIITSLLRQNDVATSFGRNNDVSGTSGYHIVACCHTIFEYSSMALANPVREGTQRKSSFQMTTPGGLHGGGRECGRLHYRIPQGLIVAMFQNTLTHWPLEDSNENLDK